MFTGLIKKDKRDLLPQKIRVSKTMRDYSNHEYFVKKAEAAKNDIKKWGLPVELTGGRPIVWIE